jgi:predicted negative regulator of RcsB-dependent stress response
MRETMKQALIWLALAAGAIVGWGMYQSHQTKVLHDRAMEQLLKP